MKTKLIILLLISSLTCHAQNAKYFAYNVLSSSLISGIGSGFHKKSGETFGHAFVNGVWKGTIGGSINYIVKFSVKKNDFLITSRLIHSIGQSCVYNGYNNQSIISNYYLTLYCFNFQTNFNNISFKLDPVTIAFTTYLSFSKKYSFNIKQSVYTGCIVFNSFIKPIHQGIFQGQSIGNVISAYKNLDPYFKPLKYSESDYKSNIRHEFTHTLQYNEFDLFTPNYKILKYINLNINFALTYGINSLFNRYSNNYFENEADNFSN